VNQNNERRYNLTTLAQNVKIRFVMQTVLTIMFSAPSQISKGSRRQHMQISIQRTYMDKEGNGRV
jgi:hypothetical protein